MSVARWSLVTPATRPDMTAVDDVWQLEEERDRLLRALDDIDAEHAAGDLDEHDYRRLADDYAARAAAVLRLIDDRRDGRQPSPAMRRSRRGVHVGAIVVFLAVVAAVLAASVGARRSAESETGATPVSDTARRGRFERLVAAHSADPVAHLSYGRYLLARRDVVGALKQFDTAATLDPTDSEAAAYAGWLTFLGGFPKQALVRLDRAEAAHPAYPDAHAFRGIVLLRGANDRAGATAELERYLALSPDGVLAAQVRAVLAELAAQPRSRSIDQNARP
jgi:tetratricopeptide (TPR) repeat protein